MLDIQHPEEWEDGFDPHVHLAMKYDMTENPERAIHPGGMSGGGLWHLKNREGTIWLPIARLAGILVAYRGLSRAMKAIRIEVLEKFLRDEVLPVIPPAGQPSTRPSITV